MTKVHVILQKHHNMLEHLDLRMDLNNDDAYDI